MLERLVLVLALVCSAALVPAEAAADRLLNAVVAAVDGQAITLRELDAYEKGRGRLLPPEDSADRKKLLAVMIVGRLYGFEFERYGMEADDEDVDAYIDRVLVERESTRESVMDALEKAGLTWRDYFERMREEVQKLTLANREIRARISITDEQIERVWLAEPKFELPERVEIGHIYMPLTAGAAPEDIEAAAERAEAAYKQARREGFAEAARAHSTGPAAAEGGALGTFTPGTLAEFIETAIEGLDEGEMSRPFVAGGAWHIVRLVRRLAASRVPLAEVTDSLRRRLYNEELERRFENWVRHELYERHHVADRYDEVQRLAAK